MNFLPTSDSDDDIPDLPEEHREVQAPVEPPGVLAAWDHDGSALTDIIDENDVYPVGSMRADLRAVAQL